MSRSTHILQHQNDIMKRLHTKVQKISELNQIVQKTMPDPLREHCQVANFNHDCLVIEVDDPAWATQLRFLIPDLLGQLRRTGLKEIVSIKHIVRKER